MSRIINKKASKDKSDGVKYPVEIPDDINALTNRKKSEFLIKLYFEFHDSKKIDIDNLNIDVLLDYISTVNQILSKESHPRIRMQSLEILHELIDVILKYFSHSYLSAIKPRERLMLVSILVKRNCYPLFHLPARQPMLDLNAFTEFIEKPQQLKKAKKSSMKSKTFDKENESVRAKKMSEKEYEKYMLDLQHKMIKQLEKGIKLSNIKSLDTDEAQMISLLSNAPEFEIICDEDIIRIRRLEDSEERQEKKTVSILLNPESKNSIKRK